MWRLTNFFSEVWIMFQLSSNRKQIISNRCCFVVLCNKLKIVQYNELMVLFKMNFFYLCFLAFLKFFIPLFPSFSYSLLFLLCLPLALSVSHFLSFISYLFHSFSHYYLFSLSSSYFLSLTLSLFFCHLFHLSRSLILSFLSLFLYHSISVS